MTSAASPSASIGTVFSRPFAFTEVWAVGVNTELTEAQWLNNLRLHPTESPGLVKRKWVYVLSDRMGIGQVLPELYAEVFTNAQGEMAILEGRARLAVEAKSAPAPSPLPGNLLVLPHTVNGVRVLYAFVVTRARLSQEALIDLCDNGNRELFRRMDLSRDDSFVAGPNGTPLVPVVDPLSVAYHLHHEYQRACIEHQNYLVPNERHTAAEATKVQNRRLAYAIAGHLQRLTEDGTELNAKYPRLHGRTARFAGDFERTEQELRRDRETFARILIRYLESGLMETASTWYRAGSPEYEHWDDAWWQCRGYVTWSQCGKAWVLSKVDEAEQKNSADRAILGMLGFIDPPADQTKNTFEACRKGNTFVMETYAELFPYIVLRKKQKLLAIAERDFSNAARVLKDAEIDLRRSIGGLKSYLKGRGIAVTWEMVEENFEEVLRRSSADARAHRVTRSTAAAMGEERQRIFVVKGEADRVSARRADAKAGVASWRDGEGKARLAEGAPRDALAALRILQAMIEIANFVWMSHDLGQADEVDWRQALAVADAIFDATEVFMDVTPDVMEAVGMKAPQMDITVRKSLKLSKVVGVVGGVIDLIQAWDAIMNAASRRNAEMVLAQSVVLVGTTAQILIAVCGGGPVLIVVAALVVAVGWVLTSLAASDDLNLFIEQCYFAPPEANDPATKAGRAIGGAFEYVFGQRKLPRWVRGTFEDWRREQGGMLFQAESLLGLLGKFSVKGESELRLRIRLGYFMPRSRLVLKFRYRPYRGEMRPFALVILPSEGKGFLVGKGADPVEVTEKYFRGLASTSSNRNFLLQFDHETIEKSECDVWMDHPLQPDARDAQLFEHSADDSTPPGWMRVTIPGLTYQLYPMKRSQAPGIPFNMKEISSIDAEPSKDDDK